MAINRKKEIENYLENIDNLNFAYDLRDYLNTEVSAKRANFFNNLESKLKEKYGSSNVVYGHDNSSQMGNRWYWLSVHKENWKSDIRVEWSGYLYKNETSDRLLGILESSFKNDNESDIKEEVKAIMLKKFGEPIKTNWDFTGITFHNPIFKELGETTEDIRVFNYNFYVKNYNASLEFIFNNMCSLVDEIDKIETINL